MSKRKAADDQALIAHQKLQIEKLNRALYDSRAERTARLIEQMELAFEEGKRSRGINRIGRNPV